MFVLLLLSWLSVAYTEVPVVKGLMYGIQPVVTAIVLDAILRVGKRTLGHALLAGFATAAFVAIFFARVPFPLVIGAAALGGLVLKQRFPAVFRAQTHGPDLAGKQAEHPARLQPFETERPSSVAALRWSARSWCSGCFRWERCGPGGAAATCSPRRCGSSPRRPW
jgi:chromate transport protein ChrA